MFTLNSHIINIWTQLIIQTFQLKLIRLIQEAGGLKKPEERTDSIKITLKDSMSMPSSNPLTTILMMLHIIKNSKDIQGCVNYFIRYAARPHG